MLTLSKYLDELKVLKGLKNDSQLAEHLHMSRAHVSQLRGGLHMGEVKCFEIAKLLNREPLELLSLNRAIRNQDKRLSNYWLEIHNKVVQNHFG